ncbi:MAG: DUF2203 domain-containing protein [Bryobacterales bacterium]|nr:DUF2203 domain-containing protein [Bryobacterales bacterium]
MKRYFTVGEANGLLGRVERHLRDALFARNEYGQAEEAFLEIQKGILMAGGSMVDRERVTRVVAKKEAARAILEQELGSLAEMGVEVKDLEVGLIDFPAWYRGEEVLLCWRIGEEEIRYWHGVTEGFRGRKEIDEAFLEGHSGESGQ